MHSRLNHIVPRSRQDTLRRRTVRVFFGSRHRLISGDSLYASLVQNQRRQLFRGRPRDEFHRESSNVTYPRLHTTTKSLAPHVTASFHEEDDTTFNDNLDREIELLTSSCLSQFLPQSLPEEIFYQQSYSHL